MFGKFGSMFGMNSTDPPDPDYKKLYEDELEADVGARRRGRRAMHKEISPYSGVKPLRLKNKIEAKANRLEEEKKYLNSKSSFEGSKVGLRAGIREVIKSSYGKENVDPDIIKSELDALDKAIAEEKKKMEEEKGFVLLQVTSDMVKGFNSSKNMAMGSSSSAPGSMIETKSDKGILGKSPLSQAVPINSGPPSISDANLNVPISCPINCNDEDMKDLMNESENLDNDAGNNAKKEQGVNFLKMDFFKPVISPATKLVSDFNKKSYARMVEATNTVVDLNIKVIPKVDGKPNGKVELPYADLMLGGAPYHATLYGFFVGKKLAFPTVNHFSFKMWKIFGLKDIMVNDEGFFFFKFDSKEGMMSVTSPKSWPEKTDFHLCF